LERQVKELNAANIALRKALTVISIGSAAAAESAGRE
jgi:hypothetical protein